MRRTVSQAGRQASRQCKVSAGREEISVHTLCTHIDTGIRAHNTKREREREARIRALARTQTDTSTESDPPAQAGHNNEATQRTMHATGFLVSHTERLSVYYASYSDWSTSGCRKSSIHPSIQHAHWLDGATAYTQTHTRRLLHSVCGTVVDSKGGTKTALRSLCMWCCSSLSLCLSISPQHMSLHVCIIIFHMAIACMEHSRPSSACMCMNIRIFLKWSALSPCTTQGLLLWLWLPARPLSICIRSLAWVCVCVSCAVARCRSPFPNGACCSKCTHFVDTVDCLNQSNNGHPCARCMPTTIGLFLLARAFSFTASIIRLPSWTTKEKGKFARVYRDAFSDGNKCLHRTPKI